MRVLVGGPRLLTLKRLDQEVSYPLIERLTRAVDRRIALLPPGTIVVHGKCDGVDEFCGAAARRRGLVVEEHPAQWEFWKKQGRPGAAGPVRTREMVALGAEHAIIWWLGLERAGECTGTFGLRKACLSKKPAIPVEERLIFTECAG